MRPPALLMQRWRSGNLTGVAKHAMFVRVRAGYIKKGYMSTTRLDDNSPIFPPLIWKGRNHDCWKGLWTPTGAWMTVPNIISKKTSKSFENQGTSQATIVMANVAFTDVEGPQGLYHLIQRGWYSPSRGVTLSTRPNLWQADEWTDVLNGGFEVEVWEGYGQGADVTPVLDPTTNRWSAPSAAKTWVGLIDSCEVTALPDEITVVARDFSVLFTDQRVLGQNKAPECRSPVSFADRKKTQGETQEAGTPEASSGTVTADPVMGAVWQSAPQPTDDKQWVEIHLPFGYYQDFYLAAGLDAMEMWVSLYLPDAGTMNSTHPLPPGWVDLGYGNVPGTTIPFIRHWSTVAKAPSRRWGLGESFDVPDDAVLRLTFGNLTRDGSSYIAAVDAFYAFRYGTNPSKDPGALVNATGWVLTEDASDVMRMLAIWCGFREWVIENFGWGLAAQMHYGQTQFFQDIVNEMLAQGNFVMFMGAPSSHDESIGVPHFVHQNASAPPQANLLEVRDTQTLQQPDVTYDLSNLPYVIRYRGQTATKAQGGQRGWGLDMVRRYQATYYPPWSGEDYVKHNGHVTRKRVPENRVAGVRRHFSKTLGQSVAIGLRSDADCYFACILAAIQFALAMATVKVQIAGVPGIELNDQISLVDEATGLNARMWVAAISDEHQMGPNGKWTMTVSGSLIDTEDMAYIFDDYYWAYLAYQANRPPSDENNPAQLPNAVGVTLTAIGGGG